MRSLIDLKKIQNSVYIVSLVFWAFSSVSYLRVYGDISTYLSGVAIVVFINTFRQGNHWEIRRTKKSVVVAGTILGLSLSGTIVLNLINLKYGHIFMGLLITILSGIKVTDKKS